MRALLDLLVPSLCDGCGARAAPPWCPACDEAAMALRPARPCRRCAGPDRAGHACWDPAAPIATTVALTSWRDPVARTVLHAKLAGRREVLAALGRRVAGLVDTPSGPVVAVPTDPRRVRERGADHTAALAGGVAAALGRPLVPALRVGTRTVDRGRGAAGDRGPLPADAFVPTRQAAAVRGGPVLLVDDLVTTGGTLAAAARTLGAAGATEVCAAVVARAGWHHLGG